MTEWQPIETAPKDGTKILVWVPGDWLSDPFIIIAVYDGRGWWTNAYRDSVWDFHPTDWMPLPEPPK